MYVCNLDCAWHMTPFPIQGFYITSEQDVTSLESHCKFVFIDSIRTRSPESFKSKLKPNPSNKKGSSPTTFKAKTKPANMKLVKRPVKYAIKVPFKKELKKASSIYKDLDNAINAMAKQLQNHSAVDLVTTVNSTKQVVGSVVRNPNAMIWVTKMKHSDTPLYQHSINCAIWAAILGREIGLAIPQIEALTAGVMLCKVGLFMLPAENDNSVELSEIREQPIYKKHVTLALKLIGKSKTLSKEIIDTVATHEERHNGTGFPQQLSEGNIPLFGRIAGLVDFYETLISSPLNAKPLSPSQALSTIYLERGSFFQAELVESFIQALGLFPPGTIVLLNNQRIAVVTSNEKNKRLQPEIIVVLDENKSPTKHRTLDLQAINKQHPNEKIEIVRCLPVGSYGIDISTLHRKMPSFMLGLFSQIAS